MKNFPILQGRVFVVELPEGAANPIIDDYLLGFNLPAPVGWGDWAEESYDTVKLPPGSRRIVSTLARFIKR